MKWKIFNPRKKNKVSRQNCHRIQCEKINEICHCLKSVERIATIHKRSFFTVNSSIRAQYVQLLLSFTVFNSFGKKRERKERKIEWKREKKSSSNNCIQKLSARLLVRKNEVGKNSTTNRKWNTLGIKRYEMESYWKRDDREHVCECIDVIYYRIRNCMSCSIFTT